MIGWILDTPLWGTECWRWECLEAVSFVVRMFGFGKLMIGGLCVMRSQRCGSFRWANHWGGGGTECGEWFGVEMLVVTVCAMFVER